MQTFQKLRTAKNTAGETHCATFLPPFEHAEVTDDLAVMADAELDVGICVEPGAGVERLAFDKGGADGVESGFADFFLKMMERVYHGAVDAIRTFFGMGALSAAIVSANRR